MNERLKELALKAYNNAGQGTPEALSSFMEVYSEKFAELIVEECGEVAYKAYWDNPETVRGIHIKEKIREHFGVEE